ncbi:hypothetical protein N658DRAFT_508970 [Parathielavia hyrcaniae]|uniref:Uncharacterized protein n=1 Tax=Parathielavia hyrcaniae TaxID=113614 RepID=A0AAN6PWL6_9PEZI|nr:hypothetical protein N658DRAFT_508970 [Parathielavia hyrcaniae]
MTQSQTDVLRILEGALNSNGDLATAAAKLADDLRQFFISSESEQTASALLWDLWAVLLNVVRIVPIEHPWHAALVAAVEGLRSTGRPVVGLEYVFDKWADDYAPKDLDTWKRFNSFASQLLRDDFTPWIVLPYWEIGAALETPLPQDSAILECKLWVATEWLTRCGQLLRRDMASAEALGERAQASIAPGPLCEGVSPQSPEQWEFWRSRLAELTRAQPLAEKDGAGEDGAGQAVLGGASLVRIAQAIAVMDAAGNSAQGL